MTFYELVVDKIVIGVKTKFNEPKINDRIRLYQKTKD